MRGSRGRQTRLINIPPLFVHMGPEGNGQAWLANIPNKNGSLRTSACAHTHKYTHAEIQMSLQKSTKVSCPLLDSPINGEANQISAANQHFISRAIWPSANCVSFKSLSISRVPLPFLLKISAFELVAFWLHGVACMGLGVVC